ncbi:MAG: hypothetical protein AB7M12_02995 [Hyphomonadaceae bacterium]
MTPVMKHKRLTYKEVLANPAGAFGAPRDVLHAEGCSLDQKREILEHWKEDAMQLQTATDENMAGGEPSRLEEVVAALNVLQRATPAQD